MWRAVNKYESYVQYHINFQIYDLAENSDIIFILIPYSKNAIKGWYYVIVESNELFLIYDDYYFTAYFFQNYF